MGLNLRWGPVRRRHAAGAAALAVLLAAGPVAAGDITPTVSITSPSAGATVEGRVDVDVAFAAAANVDQEPTGNVALVELRLDETLVGSQANAPGTKDGTVSFSVDLSSAARGPHTLSATAYQGNPSAGHAATASVTIHVAGPADTTPPTLIARVEPAANAAGWHSLAPLVTFEATDAESAIESVTPPVRVETEGASQTIAGTARDSAGNVASTSVTVNVDRTAPTLDVLAPAEGAVVTGTALVLAGTTSDLLSGLADVTCGGASASRSGSAFTCAIVLASGPNAVVVRAADLAGNVTQRTVHVTSAAAAAAAPAAGPAAATTADVSVTATASPAQVAPGGRITYTIVARNNGPARATDVVVTGALGLNAQLVSVATTQGSCSGTATVACALGDLDAGASATVTIVVVAAGGTGATVGVSAAQSDPVLANNAAGTAVAVTAEETPEAPDEVPVQGVSVVASPVSGTVLVNGRPLSTESSIPIGARVDVRNGKVRLRTTTGVGVFSAGRFRLKQARSAGAQPELQLLADVAKACAPATRRSLAAAGPRGDRTKESKKVVTRLWGQSKGARFKTTARYSSATVRGTVWLVTERCDGSFTSVRAGVVSVTDLVRRRTIALRAGQSYLARRP